MSFYPIGGTHAARFEMCERPWHGGVIIFDSGEATLQRYRISPDKPLLIQVEGKTPSADQVDLCARLWKQLVPYGFTVASFCDQLLPHCNDIMRKTELPPAA